MSTSEVLINPHPKCHIVYPCTDESRVVDAVSLFATAGLRKDEAVVLVTDQKKRERVEEQIRIEGFGVGALTDQGRLVFFDADQMLCRVLADDPEDPTLFNGVIGQIIEDARERAPSRKVRVYGEMVNLLCGRNDVEAAVRLEKWWNALIQRHSIPLLCSYSLDLHAPPGLPQELLDAHSHVLQAA